jgi:hypothetical protein
VKAKNEIQYLLECAECDAEGRTQKLGINLENGWLTIGCRNHDKAMQEFELKQPVMIEGDVDCAKCARKTNLVIGFTGDGKRVIATCEHGTLIGAFELAEPVMLKCPYCAEGAVGSHTH